MAEEILVGVDIGTQGTKAALYNERGTRLAEAFFPSQLHRPAPGVVEEDPERQLRSVCLAVKQAVGKAGIEPSSVAGLAIDGQMAGTASVFAATTSSFSPDIKDKVLGCGQSAIPGLWHPYAYINGGGINLEWFRREIANREKTEGSGALSLEDLNRAAEAIENPEAAPLFVPHFAGRVTPAMPYLRGAWVGLDWSHSMAHLYLGTLEGVALEYGIYLKVLRSLYPNLKLEEIMITGGGERSAIWNQIKADVLGIPVVQLKSSGGAPMGSALVAGLGTGLFPDLNETAREWIQTGRSFHPEMRKQEAYRLKLQRYEALIEILNTFSQPSSPGRLEAEDAERDREE